MILLILNPLFSHGGLDVLWQLAPRSLDIRITIQGIAFGSRSALRLAVVVLAFSLLTSAPSTPTTSSPS